MRALPIIAGLGVTSLTVISTTFVLLTVTSRKWSLQRYYYASGGIPNPTNDTSQVCAVSRSPFYRCGIPVVYANGTCEIDPASCRFYPPSGNTSCRSAAQLGVDPADLPFASGVLGTDQECQQVYYAGNLQIAASVFITFGLLICLGMTLLAGRAAFTGNYSATDEVTVVEAERNKDDSEVRHRNHHNHHRSDRKRRSRIAPYVLAALLPCLYIGAILQLLAQYFGVLGLTINATPSPSNALAGSADGENNFAAHTWVIDKALSTYGTIAWTSAVLAAFVASSVFRLPRAEKLL